jgi:epoxyqueuosine reductase QueG
MDKLKNYDKLHKFSIEQGVDLFGVAGIKDIREEFKILKPLADSLDKAVCIGVRLSQSILSEITDAPTRLYFHHYRTVNALLDQTALKVANFIQRKGFKALPVPASIILDWEKQSAHLSHKKLGVLAGLGWIGRNNLLVNEEMGSQFRLATILTDMPLKADKPLKRDCRGCRLCVKICPAQAIKDSPSAFEHIRCFEKLKEFQRNKLVDQYICGVCVSSCRGIK